MAGGILRFGVTHFSSSVSHHHGFPYGTLAVNIIGSFIAGYVLSAVADHRLRLLLATGFCGALTTFSAFAFESTIYWRDGRTGMMLLNIAINNLGSIAAIFAGVSAHTALNQMR